MKKLNKNLLAIFAVAGGILAGCNGGGGGSSGGGTYPTINVGMVCNPNGNQTIPFGESVVVTATLPGPTTATIQFSVQDTDYAIWSANTCQITNGTSCSITMLNINNTGSTQYPGVVNANSSGYLSGGCSLPTMLSQ